MCMTLQHLTTLTIQHYVSCTAVVDKDRAWELLWRAKDFGAGNSKANSLLWAASRLPALKGFDASKTIATEVEVQSACAANSACDAIGM